MLGAFRAESGGSERVQDVRGGQQRHGHPVGQEVLALLGAGAQLRVQGIRSEAVQGQQPARAEHPADLEDRGVPLGPVDGVVQNAVADGEGEVAVRGRDGVARALPDRDTALRVRGGPGTGGVDHALVQVHGDDVEAPVEQSQRVTATTAAEVEGGPFHRGAVEQLGQIRLYGQGAELVDRTGRVPVGGGALGRWSHVGHRASPVSS